jgi:hypothetical protein
MAYIRNRIDIGINLDVLLVKFYKFGRELKESQILESAVLLHETAQDLDLSRLSQGRPGTRIRFRAVPMEEAVRLHRTFVSRLNGARDIAVSSGTVFVRRCRDLHDVIATGAAA